MIDAGLPAPARGAFTTRGGGASSGPYASANLGLHVGDDPRAVRATRASLADAIGHPVAYLNQIHSPIVIQRTGADGEDGEDGEAPTADAQVTCTPGLVLAIMTADCAAVLLADPVAGVIGAAHCGRAGLAAGVLPATVAAMAALGAEPARTAAVIGPAICGRCYEVPPGLSSQVAGIVPEARSQTRHGTAALDIPAGAAAQLRASGLIQVRDTGWCTMEDQRFFSHRRDCGVSGRMAALAWLEGPRRDTPGPLPGAGGQVGYRRSRVLPHPHQVEE